MFNSTVSQNETTKTTRESWCVARRVESYLKLGFCAERESFAEKNEFSDETGAEVGDASDD